jgi:hypothetical protein
MVLWRDDIEALSFRPAGGDVFCMVHRLAFRTLMGRPSSKDECLAWFESHREAFEVAAQAKLAQGTVGNFHLTSRDITGQVRAISR